MAKRIVNEVSNNTEIRVEKPIKIKKLEILKKIGPKNISLIILVLIAALGIYGSFYYYNKYQTLTTNSAAEAAKETQRLVGVLGKLMELPKDETPTIATISDKEKLVDQSFFINTENGDILFAYTTAMKAILYRPSSNKIINVAPISINQGQDLSQAAKNAVSTSTTNKR